MRITRKLLIRFSRGECSPEEVLAIQEWLNDGSWPEMPQGEEVPGYIRRAVWTKIRSRMRGTISNKGKFLKIAAAIIVVVAMGLLIYTFQKTGADKPVYVTRDHEHTRIVLPDSSVVFLAPRSTLTLAAGFDDHHRELYLKGKATFEVVSDADHPFTVVSGNISATALGTSFRVNSYPKRSKINVVLSYGKVRITNNKTSGESQAMYLQPGEEAVFDKASLTIRKITVKPKRFSYKNHILYFRNAELNEVVEKLERFYQVAIDTSGLGLVKWQVSGEFKYQPLEVVMKAIAYSCNIKYERKGSKIILKQK